MTLAVEHVHDARPSRDPTQTLGLRKAFRATAKLRLRQLRAAMRVAVIDQNVLGFGSSDAIAFHPTEVRLDAFSSWLDATGRQFLLGTQWARPFIERAWRAGELKARAELGQTINASYGSAEDIILLGDIEIEGILGVTVQQVSRTAAGVIRRGTPRVRALRDLFRTFDKIAQPRLVVMADVLAIKAYNEAKLQVYRSGGITHVGIHAESLPAQRFGDAAPRGKRRRYRRPRLAEGELVGELGKELGFELLKEFIGEPATSVIKASEAVGEFSRAGLQRKYEETEVGVLTAGDDRVCEDCEEFAAGAPYEIDEVLDVLPMHPRCRCAVVPWYDKRFKGEDKEYDPNQPRVPAGSGEISGQWTAGEAGVGPAYEPGGEKYEPGRRLTSAYIHEEAPRPYKPNSVAVPDVARALNERAKNILSQEVGVEQIDRENTTPFLDAFVADTLAKELKDGLRNGHSAETWYSEKMKRTMEIAAKLHPEILTDRGKRFALTVALSIASQGEKVERAARIAEEVYTRFNAEGKFPIDIKVADPGITGNFKKMNKMIDRFGLAETEKIFNTEYTNRELLAATGWKVGKTNMDDKVYGSAILGPKIGQGFYQNLNGNFKPITMDMWFMRSWGRLTNTGIGVPDMEEQRDKFRAALKEEDKRAPTSMEDLYELAQRMVHAHDVEYKQTRRKKTKAEHAADRFVYNYEGPLVEAPKGGNDRIWITSVFDQALKILADRDGVHLTRAAAQATWWTPEQTLYRRLGGRVIQTSSDYAAAFEKIAREQGVTIDAMRFNLEFAPWIDDPDPYDEMTDAEMGRMVEGFAKLQRQTRDAGFDPNEPRDPKGKWTTGGGSEGEEGEHPGHGYSKEARVDSKGVIHTSNVEDAARALFEKRKVSLTQTRQVATLIHRLGEVSQRMVKLGRKAPIFNLCDVTVKNTNLFCVESKGIPRVKMPQLTDTQTQDFHEHLSELGYSVINTSDLASHLRATQDELNGAKVAKAAELIKTSDSYANRRIIVSRDNYVLDGHHFWAGKLALDADDGVLTNDTKIRITRIDIDIIKLLEEAETFTGGLGKKGVGQDAVKLGDLFDPNQPRVPKGSGEISGRWTSVGGGGGYEFISPNVGQIKLPEAIEGLKGDRQRNLRAAAREVNKGLKLDADTNDAVGAWADGAENSLLSTVREDTWDKLRVAAAMKAHLADQKQALVFKQDDDGTSLLYQFQVSGRDFEALHRNLLADGLAFHTIVPHINGADVYVADIDGSAHDAVAKAAERYDAKVTYQFGKAEFIGTTKEDGSDRDQRDDARRAYEEIIKQSPVPGSQKVWTRIYNHWGTSLGLNYGLVPDDVVKFKELKSKWAKVNNALLAHVDEPDGPESLAKIDELESIVKEMHSLRADPGTSGGIGLPGGPRDVTIIGAGPGGLAASINGAAEGLDTLVIEANTVAGGQAKFSSRIENFPGFPIGVTGEHLTQNMYEQAQRLGAETKLGVRVIGMTYDPSTGLKHIELSNGEHIDSRTVIMAGGLEFRRMSFPGSEGPGVIVGDGKALAKEGAGGNVCVIGGSNGAAQAALGCALRCDHVYLLARSPITDSMSDYQVEALHNNSKVTVIESDSIAKLWRDDQGKPQQIETANGKKITVKALGLFVGSVPDTKWVPSDITLAKGGRVHTNQDLETQLPGVYAVGDMRDGAVGRVGVAVGEGQLALRQANMFLEKQRAQVQADAKPHHTEDFISRLFALDRDNPWFGQTVEDVEPLKKKRLNKDFNPYHVPGGSPAGGQFTSAGSGGEGDDELGSLALGGPDRNITSATRKVDALRNQMGVTDIPIEQRQALDMYTHHSFTFNQPGTGPVSSDVKNLDKLVSSYKLPHDVTVYRTVGWHRTENILSNPDGSFSDPGFMSTTLDKSKTDRPGSYIEIQVPKGSQAFPVGTLSGFPEEAEILFPRNSRLQIVSHEPRGAPNTTRFVARLVS